MAVRISPGLGRGDDLEERVDLEEIIGLVVCVVLGAMTIQHSIAMDEPGMTAAGAVVLMGGVLIVRHLRSRVVLSRNGIELRRVFRRSTTIAWAEVESVGVASGPGPGWLNEWSSLRIDAAGRRHWVVQIRRPTDASDIDGYPAHRQDVLRSVDGFARDLDALAAEMRTAPEVAGVER